MSYLLNKNRYCAFNNAFGNRLADLLLMIQPFIKGRLIPSTFKFYCATNSEAQPLIA
jgi:hypothetical protein